MKKFIKKSMITLTVIISIIAFGGYWAFKYYGIKAPSLPDTHYYENLEERAVAAQKTVSSRGMTYLENLINSQSKNLLLWSFC